jgi:hypothetical protein
MSFDKLGKSITLLAARASTGADVATGSPVNDYRHLKVSFATDGGGTAALTVKFRGSISETAPDFTAAQSVTNMWDNIEVIDLQNGSAIDGDTGVAVASADDYRLFAVNTDGLKHFAAVVTARTAGSVTVKLLGLSNE